MTEEERQAEIVFLETAVKHAEAISGMVQGTEDIFLIARVSYLIGFLEGGIRFQKYVLEKEIQETSSP